MAESVRAQQRVAHLLRDHKEWEHVACWHLAEAARLFGHEVDAESQARKAVELAVAHGDHETEFVARRLLSALRSGEHARRRIVRPDDSFLDALSERLSRWSASRRARVPRTLSRAEWAA
jgi:hypothetical protein